MTVPAGPAVRKNIGPLLGIAFVVAILCTGLFYGAFASRFTASATRPTHAVIVAAHDLAAGSMLRREDVKIAQVEGDAGPKGTLASADQATEKRLLVAAPEGTPIVEAMLSSPAAQSALAPGMRAMTIHPGDSSSIVSVLQPGLRVDVQAWSEHGGDPRLRTILNDIEVLNAPHSADGGPANAITVLVPVASVDTLALADSAAHLRIALRNPDDSATNVSKPIGLTALFNAPEPQPATVARVSGIPAMTVSVLGISDAGLSRLGSRATAGTALSLRDLRDNGQWENTLRQAITARQAVQVTAARIGASFGDTVEFGNRNWRFRMRFTESGESRMWVEPEIVREAGTVVTTRRTRGHIDAPSSGATAVLIGGVCGNEEDRSALAEAGSAGGVPISELLVVIRSDSPALRASLPQTER